MFSTIVHQTLEDRGNPDDIENNGPFPALRSHDLYLGNGYYFWDDHLELAHWWGNVHCNGEYVICEGSLKVDLNYFLDLVGSRQDMKFFLHLLEEFSIQELEIGTAIEFLKGKSKQPGYDGLFPFKVIRAADNSDGSFKQKYFKFVRNKEGKTNLRPKYIICLISKSKLLLRQFKIVFPEIYIQD